MKILVVTCSPWREDNNIGNSYSNLFSDMDNVEFASIFLKSGVPQNKVVDRYFQITEKSLIANLLNPQKNSGKEISSNQESISFSNQEIKVYNKLRILRWQILFWGREFIWKIGRWKSKELKEFIDDFNPDIIFSPLQNTIYLNDIVLFAKSYSKKPLITYAWDDVYTLKQFSYSPLYWINRFIHRSKIRKVASESEFLYVISDLQKKEYKSLLKKECKLLFKGYDFEPNKNLDNKLPNISRPIKMLYTGNISNGRWKTLAKIGNALKKINEFGIQAQLYIYSLTPVNNQMKKSLDISGSVFLMGGVSSDEVSTLQAESDILVHVEALDLKEMLETRLSFSTKLVDYFYKSKCIFAVGKKESASIDYLVQNDAAVIAYDDNDITSELEKLIKNPEFISEYAHKAWECGIKNHQIAEIQKKLYDDFKSSSLERKKI